MGDTTEFLTKEELQYRIPSECCANCVSSYFNTYGDCCCHHLKPEDTVEYGGICYSYIPADTDSSAANSADTNSSADTANEPDVTGACETCEHSYYDDTSDKAMCRYHDCVIRDELSVCTDYKPGDADTCDEDSSADNDDDDDDSADTCETCAHSYFDSSGVPICGKHETVIVSAETQSCEDYQFEEA